MWQRVDRDSPGEQALGEGTTPARDDRGFVTQISGRARQVSDVDLGAPNRVRPRHEVCDLHAVNAVRLQLIQSLSQ